MSQYRKPRWIRVTLWIMLIGMVIASVVGVIAPYLPTAGTDIATMTQGINTATPEDTAAQINPNSILNEFQGEDVGVGSGDTNTGDAIISSGVDAVELSSGDAI